MLKGLLRIRRYNQQETPYAPQEVERLSWLQFGEAYSALRGWRPIPAALLSHSVLHCTGTEDISLPTQRLPTAWSRPTQGKIFPDKHRSIGKKSSSVKSFATIPQKFLWKSISWQDSCPASFHRNGSQVVDTTERSQRSQALRMLLILQDVRQTLLHRRLHLLRCRR